MSDGDAVHAAAVEMKKLYRKRPSSLYPSTQLGRKKKCGGVAKADLTEEDLSLLKELSSLGVEVPEGYKFETRRKFKGADRKAAAQREKIILEAMAAVKWRQAMLREEEALMRQPEYRVDPSKINVCGITLHEVLDCEAYRRPLDLSLLTENPPNLPVIPVLPNMRMEDKMRLKVANAIRLAMGIPIPNEKIKHFFYWEEDYKGNMVKRYLPMVTPKGEEMDFEQNLKEDQLVQYGGIMVTEKYKKSMVCLECYARGFMSCDRGTRRLSENDSCSFCVRFGHNCVFLEINKGADPRMEFHNPWDFRNIVHRMSVIKGVDIPDLKETIDRLPARVPNHLLVGTTMLDGIHRAMSYHLQVYQRWYGENYFNKFETTSLLALGYLGEELIREQIRDVLFPTWEDRHLKVNLKLDPEFLIPSVAERPVFSGKTGPGYRERYENWCRYRKQAPDPPLDDTLPVDSTNRTVTMSLEEQAKAQEMQQILKFMTDDHSGTLMGEVLDMIASDMSLRTSSFINTTRTASPSNTETINNASLNFDQ